MKTMTAKARERESPLRLEWPMIAIVGTLGRQSLGESGDGPGSADLRHPIDHAYRRPEAEPDLCKSCLTWGHEPPKTTDGMEPDDGAA